MTKLAFAQTDTSPDPAPEGRIDGRNLRSENTRRRIVMAARGLLEETRELPKVAHIAARAGVSVRSVFQHFQEVQTLFSTVFDEVYAQAREHTPQIDPGSSLRTRIDSFVSSRSAACEVVLPVRAVAASIEPASPAMTERANVARAFFRQAVETAFRPELDRLSHTERRITLDALRTTMDWDMWANMRLYDGLDPGDARAIWSRIVTALLEAGVMKSR